MSKLKDIEKRIKDGAKNIGEAVDKDKLLKSLKKKREILENDKIIVK